MSLATRSGRGGVFAVHRASVPASSLSPFSLSVRKTPRPWGRVSATLSSSASPDSASSGAPTGRPEASRPAYDSLSTSTAAKSKRGVIRGRGAKWTKGSLRRAARTASEVLERSPPTAARQPPSVPEARGHAKRATKAAALVTGRRGRGDRGGLGGGGGADQRDGVVEGG